MMLASIIVLGGLLTAVLLDWAIYTHLSAFLRVGLALDRHLSYRELTLIQWHKVRLFLVAVAGAGGGLAFAVRDPDLWIFSVAGFLLGHSLIYISVVKK